MASDTGVYRWDGERWKGWDPAEGAPAAEVFALLPSDGAIWTAGDGGELHHWGAESGWLRFVPNGLTHDVFAMEVSGDGSLWLGTGDGLLRYRQQ